MCCHVPDPLAIQSVTQKCWEWLGDEARMLIYSATMQQNTYKGCIDMMPEVYLSIYKYEYTRFGWYIICSLDIIWQP